MKKIMSVLLAGASITMAAAGIFADGQDIKVKVDEKNISFPDAKPYINQDNRTMVPVRFVSEALGCDVEWQEHGQLVTITKEEKRIVLQIGQNWAIVNDNDLAMKKEFDTQSVIKEDRTFVPLRFVSETLGAGVAWDVNNSMTIIKSDGTIAEVPPKVYPGGWTVGDGPDMEKRQIQVLGGMTLDIALADPIISQLMELPGTAHVSYMGPNKDSIRVGYNEYHVDGRMDVSMMVEYTPDKRNYFFHVLRDSEETRQRLKSAIAILFPDKLDMQKQIYDEIIAYKSQSGYNGYYLDETYSILVKKVSTTWVDEDPIGVWCTVKNKKRS